jgi:hypothetical protein
MAVMDGDCYVAGMGNSPHIEGRGNRSILRFVTINTNRKEGKGESDPSKTEKS